MIPSPELMVDVLRHFQHGDTYQYGKEVDGPDLFRENYRNQQEILHAVYELAQDGHLSKKTNVTRDRGGHYTCPAMTCTAQATKKGRDRLERYDEIMTKAEENGHPISVTDAWGQSYNEPRTSF